MTAKHVAAIDDSSFETEVLGSDQPYLLEVGATWCAPCRRFAPLVESVAEELSGRVRVGALDLDEAPATAARLGVRSAPTLIVFAEGVEVARHVGLTKRERIVELLCQVVPTQPPGAQRAAQG